MWDLAIDRETGDLLFGPTKDLLGVVGEKLVDQRIIVRCKIPRGTYSYDHTGSLGSRLYTISSHDPIRQANEASAIVMEALEPMTDIRCKEISTEIDTDRRLLLNVKWVPVVSLDETEDVIPESTPSFDASVTI